MSSADDARSFLLRPPRWRGLLILTVVALALLFAGDYAVLRARQAGGGAFGSVEVSHYQVVPLKGNKDEYDFVGSQDQSCVHALFPHLGQSPCWYLSSHHEKRDDL